MINEWFVCKRLHRGKPVGEGFIFHCMSVAEQVALITGTDEFGVPFTSGVAYEGFETEAEALAYIEDDKVETAFEAYVSWRNWLDKQLEDMNNGHV